MERQHFAALGGAELAPRLHQLPPLLEQVAAPIGALDGAADRVRERLFGRPRAGSSSSRPPSRGRRSGSRDGATRAFMRRPNSFASPCGRVCPPSAGKHELARAASCRGLRIASAARDSGTRCSGRLSCAPPAPSTLLREVDLGPARAEHLARPRRGQDRELERPRRRCRPTPQLAHECRHLGIRQRGVMAALGRLRLGRMWSRWPRQRAGFLSSGRQPARLGGVEHALDAAAQAFAVVRFVCHIGASTASTSSVVILSTGMGARRAASLQ